jgi:hypothetical protein
MKESCSFLLLSTGRKEIERAKNEKEKKKKEKSVSMATTAGWLDGQKVKR